jgi:hypothetical protein
MKTWITQTLAGVAALAALSLTACKKDEVQATLTPSTTAPTLTASTSSVVLTQDNAANTAATFTFTPLSFAWNNAEHPYNPATTYTLQVAKRGTNFATVLTSIDLGAGPSKSITVGNLNTQLLGSGLAVGTATPLDIRLRAAYAANSPMYSAVLPLTATVYCAQPASSQTWSIIGDAGKGWSTDVVMTYDCALNAFTYTGPLKADKFKFRYGMQWKDGLDLGGTWSATGGNLAQGGSDIAVPAAGTYTIVLKPGTIDSSNKITGASFTVK